MLRTSKPRNARSKRALEARAPREHEAAKKAIFVRGPHSSDKVALAFRDLAALKKPDAIQFAKKNDCLPFEEAGASSLEFWAGKNDASLFVVGNTQKKRKDNLAFARIFDGHVLDIIEMGVLEGKGISEFKSPFAPSLGARPLFHFSGPHFSPDASAADSDASFSGALAMCNHGVHASFQHLKSMFLDFYRGEESPPGSGPGAVPGASGNQVSLRDGLQHIVCVTEGPEPAAQAPVSDNKELAELYAAGAAQTREGSSSIDNSAAGRTVYFRVYAPRPSGRSAGGAPTMELVEVGPSFDFVLRRRQPADSARLAASLKRPKTAAEKNTQGKTKRKNVETDDMGDMIGRVHMEKQDLGKLQTRKMKGLKPGRDPAAAGGDEEMEGDDDDDSEPGFLEDSDEELIFEGSEGDEGLDADDDDEHLDDEMADMLETAGEVEAPKKKARK